MVIELSIYNIQYIIFDIQQTIFLSNIRILLKTKSISSALLSLSIQVVDLEY